MLSSFFGRMLSGCCSECSGTTGGPNWKCLLSCLVCIHRAAAQATFHTPCMIWWVDGNMPHLIDLEGFRVLTLY